MCVAILAAASHDGRRRGSVTCLYSVLKSSLPCQNLFVGIFSVSGSLEPCICFPLVASVNMMSFFLIILKYCILNEKIAHSFKGLKLLEDDLLSLPHALLFAHFPSFFCLFHSFSSSQSCSPAHQVKCVSMYVVLHTNCEKCLLFTPTVSPSLPCTLSGRAQLTCGLGTLEVPGIRGG